MFNKPAILLTPLLLAGMLAEKATLLSPEDAGPYHDRVRDVVEATPLRDGPWEGVEEKVPEPAQELLRPNVVMARRYTRTDGAGAGTLLVVHCRDSRDLGGHHPPVCYPAHGWTTEAAAAADLEVDGRRIPVMRYEFTQRIANEEARQVVYAFFVLPNQGPERDITRVRAAAADYRLRVFGAAQVQVVLPGSLPIAAERTIAADLIGLALPAVDAVTVQAGKETP